MCVPALFRSVWILLLLWRLFCLLHAYLPCSGDWTCKVPLYYSFVDEQNSISREVEWWRAYLICWMQVITQKEHACLFCMHYTDTCRRICLFSRHCCMLIKAVTKYHVVTSFVFEFWTRSLVNFAGIEVCFGALFCWPLLLNIVALYCKHLDKRVKVLLYM